MTDHDTLADRFRLNQGADQAALSPEDDAALRFILRDLAIAGLWLVGSGIAAAAVWVIAIYAFH